VDAAVQFFEDAIGRLGELSNVEDLFSTGFLLDVVGYQISLREGSFRPEVLYASVCFHAKLNTWLNAEDNRVLSSTREASIAAVYEKTRKVFTSQFSEGDAAERFRARLRGEQLAKERLNKRNQYTPQSKRAQHKQKVRMGLTALSIAAILFIGGPMIRDYWGERSRDLKSMSQEDVEAIHPMLLSGNFGRDASLILAKIKGDEWVLLSEDERKATAKEIRDGAHKHHAENVMVYYDDMMVLQIRTGNIHFIE